MEIANARLSYSIDIGIALTNTNLVSKHVPVVCIIVVTRYLSLRIALYCSNEENINLPEYILLEKQSECRVEKHFTSISKASKTIWRT